MEPPQRVRTCWLLWLPLDKGGVGVGVTPLALHSASCPWATEKLRPGRREVTWVRALGRGAFWSQGLAGVPASLDGRPQHLARALPPVDCAEPASPEPARPPGESAADLH